MTLPREVPFESLSVFINPPENALMAALSMLGWCDESGKADDHKTRFVSFAGFVAPEGSWKPFEAAWTAMLAKHEVPFLHMKLLHRCYAPYEHWKDKPESVALFIQDAVKVIEDAKLMAYGCVVLRDDLRRYSKERGVNIEAYAFTIYITLVQIMLQHPQASVQLVIDRIEQGHTKVALAERYFKSDRFMGSLPLPTTTPLSPDSQISSANCSPLQAADFLAWELRKSVDLKADWFENVRPTLRPEEWERSMMHAQADAKGIETITQENYLDVRERRSLAALIRAVETHGLVFDYQQLCQMEASRGESWG